MPQEITPKEVQRKQQNGDRVQIIDIRDTEAYEDGHIPDSDNLPIDELTDHVDDVEWMNNDDEEIVVACYIGESSIQAARMLEAYDGTGNATVSAMVGGYEEWSGALNDEG